MTSTVVSDAASTWRSAGLAPSRGRRRYFAVMALVLLLLAVAPFAISPGNVRLLTEVAIWSLFVVSLNLLVTTSGLVSLGHIAYWAVSAYTVGILITRFELSPFIALAIGPVAAAALGLVFGAVAVRRSHAYFVLLTFALGQVVYTIVFRWRGVTRGDDGLLGVARPDVIVTSRSYYYFAVVVVVAAVLLLRLVSESSFGYTMRAIRDSPERAASSGIGIYRYRVAAFTVSSFFAGIAGGLWALYQGSVFPETAHWLGSAEGLVMIALGGGANFAGPILGAGIYTVLARSAAQFTPYWLMVIGFVILAVSLMGLEGITRLRLGRSRRS